ncbi:hypothetical protein MJ560_02890 [Klebsiella pneumoniae]|nr:hypothetical protein MJ560_02890 [Klebsiella pneumoniae]
MLIPLFGVGVASLYVAPPLYDAKAIFCVIQPGGKSDFARYDAYLYNLSGVDGEKMSI